MQYVNRAMHEGYQESLVGKKKSTTTQLCISSSSCDLQVQRISRPSQGSGIQARRLSRPPHSKAALDLSGTTTQPADQNVQRNSAHKGIRLNMARHQCPAQICFLTDSRRSITGTAQSSNLNGENHQLEFVKLLEPATTSLLFHKSVYKFKLVSIGRPKEDEPSATNLAPNNGGNRR
ncbi:phospholipid-transporting ATPase 4 [Dorcoceras hygrometricum]|uniref:Phospholipid-transporting ATPase 4 n=1 Tax=Dorcoceras hygrometricum TaxID=472368 RepID=A0A2Z7CN06_9LAMI|nr:phospholipid-transporting ATPase 4 [Dorcoceras hygrometricum]